MFELMQHLNNLLFREKLWVLNALLFVSKRMDEVYGKIVSKPVLPTSVQFSSHFSDIQVSLSQVLGFSNRRNCFICRCRFIVFMGEVEFKIYITILNHNP